MDQNSLAMDGKSASEILSRLDNLEDKLDKIAGFLKVAGISSQERATTYKKSSRAKRSTLAASSKRKGRWKAVKDQVMQDMTLPPGWKKHMDPASHKYFFQNIFTEEVQWERPTEEAVQYEYDYAQHN